MAEADPQDLASLFANPPTGATAPAAMLTRFDEVLARNPQPNKLRGLVQFLRSSILANTHRYPEATIATEESIRLLPTYSGPLFLAANIHTYSGKPGRAADFLLRAAALDRASALKYPDYELMGLLMRLDDVNDHRKAQLLADRFLDLGWSGTTLDAGSKLAVKAIRMNAEAGKLDRARSLVTRITVPVHGQDLLVDRSFEFLWPAMEQWGGARLEKLWRIHLPESRNRFKASSDDTTMVDFSKALESANRSAELVDQFLPLFSPNTIRKQREDLLFVVTDLSQALVRQGQMGEADLLWDRARSTWPLAERANHLNVHANYGMHLLVTDRPREALTVYDQVLATAARFGDEVNGNALWAMRHYRACALYEVGRTSEAMVEAELLLNVGASSALNTFLCIDRPDRAKQVLLRWLKSDDRKGLALDFMQPRASPPPPTAYGRRQRDQSDKVWNDPDARNAVAQVGRILPFSLSDGATAVP